MWDRLKAIKSRQAADGKRLTLSLGKMPRPGCGGCYGAGGSRSLSLSVYESDGYTKPVSWFSRRLIWSSSRRWSSLASVKRALLGSVGCPSTKRRRVFDVRKVIPNHSLSGAGARRLIACVNRRLLSSENKTTLP